MGKAKIEYSRELVENLLHFPPGTKLLGCWFEPGNINSEFEEHRGIIRFLVENDALPNTILPSKNVTIVVTRDEDGTVTSEFTGI